MTTDNNNVNMDTHTPLDKITDAMLEPADTTSYHNDKIGPVLAKIFEELSDSKSGRLDAESLRKWIESATGQGLEMRDGDGRTLLHVAAGQRLSEAAEKLIHVIPDLDVQDSSERTPIFEACLNHHEDIVKLLLDNGANAELQDKHQQTPLYIAARQGTVEIVQLLCDKPECGLNSRSSMFDWTPLHAAAANGDKAIVHCLRVKGAKLDIQDSDGWTPLMTATIFEKKEAMEGLVEKLGDEDLQLDKGDSDGQVPLMAAARRSFWEGARLLVEAGAKCDKSKASKPADTHPTSIVTPREDTVLHLAVFANQIELVDLLLQSGADVNAQNDDGITPLHLASSAHEPGRYIEVIRLLLKRRADLTAVTNDNKTALELAFDSGHLQAGEEIINSLMSFGEASNTFSHALLRAASDSKRHVIATKLLKRQLEQSMKPSCENSQGWTAIEWAAYAENPDVLWLLIASSPRSEETKKALDSAENLVQPKPQGVRTAMETWTQKVEEVDDVKKRGKGHKEDLIRDIIKNPPIGTIYSNRQEYGRPNFEEKFSSLLDNYEAAIVQFYEKEAQFGSIVTSQSVKKTIYTEGPKKIKVDAINKLKSQAERLEKWIKQDSPALPFLNSNGSKFTWVHLPATNMTWMDDLLQRIMKDQESPASDFNQAESFFKDSWIEVPDKLSPSRIMRPRFVWHDGNGNRVQNEDFSRKKPVMQDPKDTQNKDGTANPSLSAVYMPYFSYAFECDEDVMEESRGTEEQSHSNPNEEELKYAQTLTGTRNRYHELLRDYEKNIIHGSSTLDESYYHFGDDTGSQKDKKRRNKSQVVTGSWGQKWRENQEPGLYWPLIRVNQLWMWTIGEKWLISASSHPTDDHKNELLDGILDLLEKQRVAGGSGLQPSSASEMSQFIVDYCVESYERKPRGIKGDRPKDCKLEDLLSIRQTFSKSINSIARAETDLFEKFSKLTKYSRALGAQSTGGQGHSLNGQLTAATFSAEELSGQVKDILDELNSLEATVHYQQDVQKSMKSMKLMKEQALQMVIKNNVVPETDLSATYIIKDIKRLDSVAKRVHDAVNTTLSLQQSEVANLQAKFSIQQSDFSIKQTDFSIQQADHSAKQGRVLMVFTVVTILFLPLSFLTSFFALDVSSFQAPAWAVGIIFSISVAFSIPTVVLAFTWSQSKAFMSDHLLEPPVRSYFMFSSYARILVLAIKKKQADNKRSNLDPRDTRASFQVAAQNNSSALDRHETRDRGGSISHMA